MTKLMLSLATTAAAVGGFAVLPAPAVAQQASGEVVVFGNDPCPRSTDSQVYVCTRRPEQERYRLPKDMQLQGTRQQRNSWANKSRALNRVGNTGINSCSAVGPGGHTGCLIEEIKQARRETQEATEQATAPEQ
jgi:hypothetical protein